MFQKLERAETVEPESLVAMFLQTVYPIHCRKYQRSRHREL